MLASQIAGILELKYSTVDEMTIAKQAYRYVYDTENYGLVVNTIQSKSKQKELLTFLNASAATTSTSHASSTHQTTTNSSISTNISIQEQTGGRLPNTTTTTTTTTSGTMTSNQDTGTSRPTSVTSQAVNYGWVSGYSGRIGCSSGQLVNEEEVIKIAENESFSEGRMKIVKQAARGKCMTVDQISAISSVFTFEEDKLSFVKWAYDLTYDIDNYYKLNSIFTFSSSKDELDTYLETK